MKQIPVKYLPDDLMVRPLDTEAEYDGEYLESVFISNVRFERAENLNPKIYQLAEGSQGRIWIDAVNSKGSFEVLKGSLVTVIRKSLMQDEMQVIACMPYEITGQVHHWELDVK